MTDTDNREAGNNDTCVIDIAAGLFLAAMAIGALIWLIPNNVEVGTSKHDVGPAFFPRLTALAVLGFSLTLVIANAVRYRKSNRGLSGAWIIIEAFLWGSVSFAVILGISWFGFLFTASLLIAIGAIASGYGTLWIIALLAIAFPVALDQAAWLVFTVDLP